MTSNSKETEAGKTESNREGSGQLEGSTECPGRQEIFLINIPKNCYPVGYPPPPPPPPCLCCPPIGQNIFNRRVIKKSLSCCSDKDSIILKLRSLLSENKSNVDNKRLATMMQNVCEALTPAILDELKLLFTDGLGMSETEANKVLNAKRGNRKLKFSCVPGNWIEEASCVLSTKLMEYIELMLCTERTEYQQDLANKILNSLCQLFGEEINRKTPKTRIQRLLNFVADRLALWVTRETARSGKAGKELKEFRGKREKANEIRPEFELGEKKLGEDRFRKKLNMDYSNGNQGTRLHDGTRHIRSPDMTSKEIEFGKKKKIEKILELVAESILNMKEISRSAASSKTTHSKNDVSNDSSKLEVEKEGSEGVREVQEIEVIENFEIVEDENPQEKAESVKELNTKHKLEKDKTRQKELKERLLEKLLKKMGPSIDSLEKDEIEEIVDRLATWIEVIVSETE